MLLDLLTVLVLIVLYLVSCWLQTVKITWNNIIKIALYVFALDKLNLYLCVCVLLMYYNAYFAKVLFHEFKVEQEKEIAGCAPLN